MLNGKTTVVPSTFGLIKNILRTTEHFLQQKSLGGRVELGLDLSSYATRADLKNATGVDTSFFAKKLI